MLCADPAAAFQEAPETCNWKGFNDRPKPRAEYIAAYRPVEEGQCIGCRCAATWVLVLKWRQSHARLCDHCIHGRVGWVYLIRGGVHVKIGYALNPVQRLRGFETGSPVPLELWAYFPAEPKVERLLHSEFKQDRAHGEWFHVSPALEAFAQQLNTPGLLMPAVAAEAEK